MNKVILTGRLTKDPELKTTSSGLAISTFSIAVTRTFKNKEGSYDADFFNVSVFGKQAENVSKFCFKGSLIGLEGRIQSRSYDAQDGTKRYVVDVVADRVEFLGSKKDNNTNYASDTAFMDPTPQMPMDIDMGNQNNEISVPEGNPYKDFNSDVVITDDDLPF